MVRLRIILGLLLFWSAAAGQTITRINLDELEKSPDAGRFIVANTALDATWSADVRWLDSLVHVYGGLIVDNVRQGTSDNILVIDGTGRIQYRPIDDIISGGGAPTGSGTLNYVAKWTPDGNTLGNSQIFDDGTYVGIGTAVPANALDVRSSTSAIQAYATGNYTDATLKLSARTNSESGRVSFNIWTDYSTPGGDPVGQQALSIASSVLGTGSTWMMRFRSDLNGVAIGPIAGNTYIDDALVIYSGGNQRVPGTYAGDGLTIKMYSPGSYANDYPSIKLNHGDGGVGYGTGSAEIGFKTQYGELTFDLLTSGEDNGFQFNKQGTEIFSILTDKSVQFIPQTIAPTGVEGKIYNDDVWFKGHDGTQYFYFAKAANASFTEFAVPYGGPNGELIEEPAQFYYNSTELYLGNNDLHLVSGSSTDYSQIKIGSTSDAGATRLELGMYKTGSLTGGTVASNSGIYVWTDRDANGTGGALGELFVVYHRGASDLTAATKTIESGYYGSAGNDDYRTYIREHLFYTGGDVGLPANLGYLLMVDTTAAYGEVLKVPVEDILTDVGVPTGSGTLNYVVKWTPDGNTLGDSQIFDNGTRIGFGTNTPDSGAKYHFKGTTSNEGVLIEGPSNASVSNAYALLILRPGSDAANSLKMLTQTTGTAGTQQMTWEWGNTHALGGHNLYIDDNNDNHIAQWLYTGKFGFGNGDSPVATVDITGNFNMNSPSSAAYFGVQVPNAAGNRIFFETINASSNTSSYEQFVVKANSNFLYLDMKADNGSNPSSSVVRAISTRTDQQAWLSLATGQGTNQLIGFSVRSGKAVAGDRGYLGNGAPISTLDVNGYMNLRAQGSAPTNVAGNMYFETSGAWFRGQDGLGNDDYFARAHSASYTPNYMLYGDSDGDIRETNQMQFDPSVSRIYFGGLGSGTETGRVNVFTNGGGTPVIIWAKNTFDNGGARIILSHVYGATTYSAQWSLSGTDNTLKWSHSGGPASYGYLGLTPDGGQQEVVIGNVPPGFVMSDDRFVLTVMGYGGTGAKGLNIRNGSTNTYSSLFMTANIDSTYFQIIGPRDQFATMRTDFKNVNTDITHPPTMNGFSFNDKVNIGTTATASYTLDVQGTARILTATGTPTTIAGRGSSGEVGDITTGPGLSLTTGTLAVNNATVPFGSGLTDRVATWADANTLTYGILYDDGSKVGINTAPDPTTWLYLNDTVTENSSWYGLATSLIFKPSVNMGALTEQIGNWVYIYVDPTNTHTVSSLEGIQVTAEGYGTGNVTQIYAIRALSASSSVTTNLFGIYADASVVTGATVTNRYVLYLSNLSDGASPSGNNFSLYNSSQLKSYFNGSVGIGMSPTYKLDMRSVTNSAVGLPNVATASLPTGYEGGFLYNTTEQRPCWYDGTQWRCVAHVDEIGGGGTEISSLLAAIATNTIDNVAYQQTWTWNSLAGGMGLSLTSSSTAATGDSQKLLNVALTGANANSGELTTAINASNAHTGTSSANYSVRGLSSGGASINVGVYGSGTGTGARGVAGTSTSDNGFGGEFWNSGTTGTGYGLQAYATGAKTTNIGASFSASGGTNNYAIIVPSGGGNVGIGGYPSYTLDMSGRTDAMVPPKGTTAQEPAGTTGALRYDTDQLRLTLYGGSSWQPIALKGTDTYDGWNLQANAGASTQIADAETVTFSDGDGTTASRASNTITYDVAASAIEIEDGTDDAPANTTLDNYVFYAVHIKLTAGATSNGTFTLPTPTSGLLHVLVTVSAEDASGSFVPEVVAGTNEIWEQGSTASSRTLTNNETIQMRVIRVANGGVGSDWKWAIISSY